MERKEEEGSSPFPQRVSLRYDHLSYSMIFTISIYRKSTLAQEALSNLLTETKFFYHLVPHIKDIFLNLTKFIPEKIHAFLFQNHPT